MKRKRLVFFGVGGLAFAALCVWMYGALYGGPRESLLARLAAATKASDSLEYEIERDQFRVNSAIKALAQRTLGRKLDAVEHRLREDLSQIALHSGMRVESVASGTPKVEPNPAALASIPSALRTRLRNGTDFYVIKGSFRGEGDLAAALRMLSAVQSQPWLLRVDGFDIKPANKEKTLFTLRLDISTPFVPDLGPETTQLAIAEPPAGSEAMWRPMAERNPFRDPIPAVSSQPNTVAINPQPDGPAAPPTVALGPTYADWLLTGIIHGRRGVEILLVNARTGERLSLAVGNKVMDATVVGGEGEEAVFEINGVRFTVTNGQTLADRRPVG